LQKSLKKEPYRTKAYKKHQLLRQRASAEHAILKGFKKNIENLL
jgi:hypothetical protein